MGYRPVLAPMLHIEAIDPPLPHDLSGVQAVLITSTNGIEHFAALTPTRDLTILAVGDRTASAARDLGFKTVTSANGGGADLLALARDLDPKSGSILHPRGEDAAVSFEALKADGFDFREIIVYRAVQAADLPTDAESPKPKAALIYSARTAEAFANALTRSASLNPADLLVVGISKSALRPLENLGIQRAFTAPKPNESAILETLKTHLPTTE